MIADVSLRFSALVDEREEIQDVSMKYDLLFMTNKEDAREEATEKDKRPDPISDREEVQTARCVLKKASEAHYIRPTRGSLDRLEVAKSALDNAYNKVIDEELRSKAEELERSHEENRHTAAWAVLRELTDKRSSPVIKIQGADSKERLTLDYITSAHFSVNQNKIMSTST